MITETIKLQFPIFKNNPNLVYLDNAATSQKPQSVLDAISQYNEVYCANVHRGIYPLSEKATEEYENARKVVAEFINADPEEIIFTSGTTDGLNMLVKSLQDSGMLHDNSNVLLSELEHHSNIVPWQEAPHKSLQFIEVDKNYELRITNYELREYDIVSLTAASNVIGSITDLNIFNSQPITHNSILVLDAAQAVAHFPLDVKKLNVDFMVFSGHKMYGPTGIGVLYGKKELLQRMKPFRFGGGMINEVQREKSTFLDSPHKFEAGTPNIAGTIGLAAAVRFIESVGFEDILKHENDLREHLVQGMHTIQVHTNSIKIFHPSLDTEAICTLSFHIEDIHPHDIAQFLGDKGICVRAGHHCTQILHRDVFNVPATTRISLGVYNTKDDIDKFIEALNAAIKYYK